MDKKYIFELGGWDAVLPLVNKNVWQDKSSILIDSVSYKTANNYVCSYTIIIRKNWAILWFFGLFAAKFDKNSQIGPISERLFVPKTANKTSVRTPKESA